MNRSPLHQTNAALGARFVDFGGWEMPVQYKSVLAEHRAVRTKAGFFDVTHLGRFQLTGSGAHAAIRRLLCNDIDSGAGTLSVHDDPQRERRNHRRHDRLVVGSRAVLGVAERG